MLGRHNSSACEATPEEQLAGRQWTLLSTTGIGRRSPIFLHCVVECTREKTLLSDESLEPWRHCAPGALPEELLDFCNCQCVRLAGSLSRVQKIDLHQSTSTELINVVVHELMKFSQPLKLDKWEP